MPTIAEIKAEVDEHYASLADQPPQTPAQIEACKALIYLFTVTFRYHMYDETAKLVSEDYIQHNEDLGTGRQSIIDFAESRTKGVYWNMRFKRIIVDGEYVGGQLHVKSSPEDEGVRVFELLRYKNGVFVEHWDVMQPIKPASERKNPIGVF